MNKHIEGGQRIRQAAKQLVLDYMHCSAACASNAQGLKQAVIFRECGLDWGSYPKSSSSSQQNWLAALLQELAKDGIVERIGESGPWRLKLKS